MKRTVRSTSDRERAKSATGRTVQTLRTKLRQRLRLVEAEFSRHLGKGGSARSITCVTCNHYFGQRLSLQFALELFKKKPNLDKIRSPDDQ